MDPIIRHAPVSPFARRIGRPAPAACASQESASGSLKIAPMAPVAATIPVARGGTPGVYLAATAPVAPPDSTDLAAAEREFAARLALGATEHAAALQQRDREIAALRLASDNASRALAESQADAERRGYAAGIGKGEEAGRAALAAQAERLRGMLALIGAARDAAIDDAEPAMVEIAFSAVCRILGEQGTARESIAGAVRMAMAAMRSREQLTVRLHPGDVALVDDDARPQQGVCFVADSQVVLGGCIVDSAGGTLDARFETQLTQLAAALKAARAPRAQSPAAS